MTTAQTPARDSSFVPKETTSGCHDLDDEAGDGCFAALVDAFHARDVMTGFGVTMLRHGVTIFAERFRVAVGLHFHLGGAIAEIPGLTAGSRAKCPHFECHRVVRVNAERRSVRS